MEGKNLLSDDIDPVLLRRAVSMVFQKANVFPTSIYENVLSALEFREKDKTELDAIIEESLNDAFLWMRSKIGWKRTLIPCQVANNRDYASLEPLLRNPQFYSWMNQHLP